MKKILITVNYNSHLETELINSNGDTFTYNPNGRDEELDNFILSSKEIESKDCDHKYLIYNHNGKARPVSVCLNCNNVLRF